MSFYITTPIYYVNSKPHLGHAYTTILCDVVHRFYLLAEGKSYFLTGTDEHGDKIEKAALANNISTQQLVDENSQKFRELLPIINTVPSDFIRTTESRHKMAVQHILQKVYEKGDIYQAEYSGKYCYGCERYLGDDELTDGKCPDHAKEPELIKETNYFFKMSKYWEQLKSHVNEQQDFVVPSNFRNEVIGLLKQEPQDLCISRPKSRLTWGIELPFDKDYVTYVWFDALINYLSAIEFPEGDKFKNLWGNSHHVIAKDILKPHCVYWPTMLLSLGITLPKQIAIHGYWLIDESKMSKSTGRTVDPSEYCTKYGSDIFRYFLMRGMRFGKDASFSHPDFLQMVNADCANNFGNLFSRIVGLCRKNCDGQIPEAQDLGEREKIIEKNGTILGNKLVQHIQEWKTAEYLETLVEYANELNKYLDETKPWSLAKDPSKSQELKTILRVGLEGIRICFTWLLPITPITSQKVLENLEIPLEDALASTKQFFSLKTGQTLPQTIAGFPRLE